MARGEAGRDLLAYLYRHTEGNPLHLAHLLRDLEEGGHLTSEGERWRWSDLRDLPGEVTLSEVVARRVARLPAHCVPVLELVATLDREFDEAFLRRAREWDDEELREGIRCLVEARLLTPTYDRDTASYLFSHDELARVTREGLTPEARRQLHGCVAVALAETGGASASLIASHFEAAGLSAESHRYAVLAADAALSLYDSGAASALLTAAARHAPSSGALANVRVRLAELAEAGGHYEDAEALCDLALNWYEGDEDPVQAIRLKRMRTLVRMQRGQGARETLSALFALVDEATLAGADAERASILLISSQMLARLGEQRESQHVAEECLGIAERCADPVLLADCYNRVAVANLLSDAPRARSLFDKALEVIVPLRDAMRRSRTLNNIGILDMMENRWTAAHDSFTSAVEFARTAGLTEHWGRAALNLGVLAIRTANFESAASWLGEALRIGAEAQSSELQLAATYNLANLARDTGDFARARDTYELANDLAERIGQSEIQLGAMAGLALSDLASGRIEEAREIHEQLQPRLSSFSDWFQGRELVEALGIRLAILSGGDEASHLFTRAVTLADTRDVYGAALLTAEFGPLLRASAPDVVQDAVQRYAQRPEVVENPRIRHQFGVLILDTANDC